MPSDSTYPRRQPVAGAPQGEAPHPEAAPQRSLAGFAAAYPRVFLILLTAAYAYGAICAASRRHFEFDETVMYYIAELPDIRQIWFVIGKGIELNPPLPFWINWAVHHTIGGGEIASRLPALAGFWLMCFCLYQFVRRRCGVIFGFVAFLLPMFTYPAWDSAVARGYGLMLGASALAFLCWQLVCDGARRWLSLVGLALGAAVAVSCHYYAVYVVAALCAGEIMRTWVRRRLDLSVWAAFTAGLSPLAIYVPLLRAATAGGMKNFWVSATPLFLYESYAGLVGPSAMVFLLLLTILLRPAKGDAADEEEIAWSAPAPRVYEMTACFLLLAMPLILYLAGFFGGVPFYTRYVMPVTIGFTLTMAMFAHRIGGASRRFQRVLLALLVSCCLIPWMLLGTFRVRATKPPSRDLESLMTFPADTSLPVVFDSETPDFLEYYHYGTPAVRARIYNLVDREAAVRYRGTDTGLRTMLVAQTFRDFHTRDYRAFLAQHSEFYVIRLHEEGWVLQKLLADGAEIRLLRLEKGLGTFVQSNTIFRVSLPPVTGR